MKIRLTQLDGSLPNLALMKLAHWRRSRGDEVAIKDAQADLGGDLTVDLVSFSM